MKRLLKALSILVIITFIYFNSYGYIFAGTFSKPITNEHSDAYTNENKNVSPFVEKDFKGNRKEAKEWAEQKFKVWKQSLNHEQKKLLDDSARFQKVNTELEKFRGNIKDESTTRDVDRIDKVLKNRHAKLDHSVYVYRNFKSKELGFKGSLYEKEKMTIDKEQYRQFSNDFKYGMIHDFMNANLSKDSGNRSQPILLYLKVPKGSSMGHLKDDQVFIDRNQGFEVKSMKIILEKGREVIKVEAELVPAADVLKKVKDIETQMNTKFNTETNLNLKAVHLKVDGFYSSVVTQRSEELFNQLTSSVPKNGLSSIVSKMNKDGAIIFTDQDGAARGKDTKGAYDKESKSLWVQINHEGHNLEKDADRKTLFHEFGRAQDELLFKNQSKKENFQKIYEVEKNNITIDDSIKKNAEEFFAGVFSNLFSPDSKKREQIQTEAPKTSEFIRNLYQHATDFNGVKNYLIQYKILPLNFITKAEASKLGWKPGVDLNKVAPGKSIGGDVFKNLEGKLPKKDGRTWYEVDIDFKGGKRGQKGFYLQTIAVMKLH
ncbi:ADP-ribosyltransferase [Paenibacillus larvae]|uniref:ADP-ribosyltransferase n=1 Tax=Paenibacillus larvae TaxID=1464 RepID=UPI001F3FA8B9|nr:ADP-ribosyltransferase [Paenibacillus larvae]